MNEHLHIVCLDAPAPPDYGGAIEMYYKIRALAKTGKKIILHYFDYNPLRNTKGLEEFCMAIHAYKRRSIFTSLPLFRPYIVQSRINEDLVKRLNQDNYPILLEGLHCSGIVDSIKEKTRIVVRMHNDEASYYQHLAKSETALLKRRYFIQESRLLHQYQHALDKRVKLACLSQSDMQSFENVYQFKHTHFIPCFIPWQRISSNEGIGTYCLYHGNMLVSENEEAAVWLIEEIFSKCDLPFIIAGKGISGRLVKLAAAHKNIKLVSQLTITQIDHLIQDAHVNVLPSMNSTGVKLKLLNALLNGRHCITNFNGVKGSDIEGSVSIAESSKEWLELLKPMMQQAFTPQHIEARSKILERYDNMKNATLLNALW